MDRDFPGQRLSLTTQYNSFFYGPKSAKNVLTVTNMVFKTKWNLERKSERVSRELACILVVDRGPNGLLTS